MNSFTKFNRIINVSGKKVCIISVIINSMLPMLLTELVLNLQYFFTDKFFYIQKMEEYLSSKHL